MNILQISAPKTGSYWLNTILKEVLTKKNIEISSYIKEQPEYQELQNEKLSFKGQAGVDMVDIQEDGYFFRVSSLLRKEINDLEDYTSKAQLSWTHSTWCTKSEKFFEKYDKKIIIVRDPRDRALSSAKFAFTPYMQKHYPSSHSSEEAFFNNEYENLMARWVWFYGNYLLHKNELDLHFVFYENLLEDFEPEFDRLLKYLAVEINSEEKAEIARNVSFKSMKEESPRHLQKGRSRKWVGRLEPQQKERALEIAGELMKILNYPLKATEDSMPRVPDELPKKQLQDMLHKVNWKNLYSEDF